VDPEYTEEARKAGLEGTVILYAEVGTDGYARNIRVTRRLGLGLDEKAVEAVRKWKFRPGFKDAKPVVVVSNTEVNFRLPHEPAPENPLASGNSGASPLMLQGSSSYLQQRLHFWQLKDAKAELGRVVGHPRNLGPETFTFVDPTRRYRVFDLTFDSQTKKLVEIRVHPWGGLRWNECKAIWGSNYSQSTTEEPGVLAYSYRTRPITALVRRSGEVVSFDFH
jgi:TonB family protein